MSQQSYIYTLKEGWLEVDELVPVESGRQFDFRYFNMPSEFDPVEILAIPGELTSTEKQILRQNTAEALRRFGRGELE